jgi:hypothetical protein
LAAVAPAGIVHRDLKPENVMVAADGSVKIADFGIAKATQTAGAVTTFGSSGVTVGTPAYMAPEQALCEPVGPWTDLYSVGVMAYEQLVGRVPFYDAPTPVAMLLRHINDPIPPVDHVDPGIDSGLSAWVSRLLAREPDRRPSSPVTAWEEVEEIVIGLLGPRWRREARLIDSGPGRTEPGARFDLPQFTSQSISVDALGAHFQTRRSSERPVGLATLPVEARGPVVRSAPRRSLWLLPGAAAVIVAVGGFGLGRVAGIRGAGRSAAPTVVDGALAVTLPMGWRQAASTGATPGYLFDRPLTLEAAGGASLTLGLSSAPSAALLPAALVAHGGPAQSREAVSLGGRAYLRYPALTPSDGLGPATLYTESTTGGVLVGLCRRSTAPSAVADADCERILRSLELRSVRPLPSGQATRYVASLASTLDELNRVRAPFVASLAAAVDARTQAAAAASLVIAYSRAAASLRAAAPGPSEAILNSSLDGALARVAGGYEKIAGAARQESAGAYQAGGREVSAGVLELRRALAGLMVTG